MRAALAGHPAGGRRRGAALWASAVAVASVALASCATGYPLQRDAAGCGQSTLPGRSVSLLTWNLGYGGEGASTSLVYDGGRRLLPSNRTEVLANTAGIVATLRRNPVGIYLLQEVARPSTINHNVNLLGRIVSALPRYAASYSPKISEVFLGVHLSIGEAVLARTSPSSEERIALPGVPGPHLLKQRYFLLVTRFPLSGSRHELVVANLHLAVIDKGARTRMAQLEAIERFMASEYRKGNYVIVGGDWNLELTRTDFASTTSRKHLRWVHAMPLWFPPAGWKRAYAGGVPTVRSLDQPYRPGRNFTTIGDGFVYSPNLSLAQIRVVQDGFAYSDHQPVVAEFRFLDGQSAGRLH